MPRFYNLCVFLLFRSGDSCEIKALPLCSRLVGFFWNLNSNMCPVLPTFPPQANRDYAPYFTRAASVELYAASLSYTFCFPPTVYPLASPPFVQLLQHQYVDAAAQSASLLSRRCFSLWL